MVSFTNLLTAINETIVFQGTNHPFSVESDELFEKRLRFIRENADEIMDAKKRSIAKCASTVSYKIRSCKPLNNSEMKLCVKAVGFSIGMPESASLIALVERALENVPVRNRKGSNYLMICEWNRIERRLRQVIFGAKNEIKKFKGKE